MFRGLALSLSFEWSHIGVSCTDLKGTTTFIDSRFDSGSEMVKGVFRPLNAAVGCFDQITPGSVLFLTFYLIYL